MGKKGNWFSAIKRAFTPSSKDSVIYSSDKENVRDKKKWGVGRSKHGEANSLISLNREPSSIEKILGDAEREQQFQRTYQEQPKKVQHLRSIYEESHKNVQHFHSPREEPPKIKAQYLQEPKRESLKKDRHIKTPKLKQGIVTYRRGINENYAQSSAIKIQAAYRGYMARKNYRTLKGLVRLQKVMRGQSVKRQTSNTMKCMKLLVKVQSQIRARRLQMIENRNIQHHQTNGRSEKEVASSFSRWNLSQSEAEADEEWDDSVLTKEERDSRTRRKVEAVIKRERALAYAYSHQLLKVTPKSAHAVLTDIRSGGYPWWWNWLDRHLPTEPPQNTPKFASVAPQTTSFHPSIQNQANKDIFFDLSTPRSSKVLPSPRSKLSLKTSNKRHQSSMRDDDSLTSCPAFRPVPNYMAPTVSAKAKVRENQIDGGRDGRNGEKKKFSFSLTQSIGSLRWGKGPLFAAAKEPVTVQRAARGKHRSTNSIGGASVDSTVSLPVGVGRKPFK
ncbi:uncharacterized protein A4U43_C10F14300 [Asparagus officinalis]|uniref:DUF4005 domain-containing protein n=1 Tax=Asparagus officinalis TaxID=4686 RepID=A0A5P1E2X4_ASPOF|nr:protein IQ-DOMAIN 14-like [Asparagus officinalis]ONK56890.1 uncharacterized protein A4U43_C10F14300 [Asparagus officinalis]